MHERGRGYFADGSRVAVRPARRDMSTLWLSCAPILVSRPRFALAARLMGAPLPPRGDSRVVSSTSRRHADRFKGSVGPCTRALPILLFSRTHLPLSSHAIDL